MSVTLIIIILTGLTSYLAFSDNNLRYKLLFYPFQIKQGKEYYRFITSGFVHGDWQHLLFNMFTFYFFGRNMQFYFQELSSPLVGTVKFLVLYLGGIIFSDIYSYYKHKDNPNYMALGASGGVSAVVFGAIMFGPWQTLYIYFIPMPSILFAVGYLWYSARMAKQGNDNIGHEAHFFGAIYGAVVTLLIEPKAFGIFFNQLMNPSFF